MATKKDEGPNLMYNQLRKFITVVVSTLPLILQKWLCTHINNLLSLLGRA